MSELKTLEDKVLATLAYDKQSRNSDIRLTQVLWYKFYREHLSVIDGQWYVKLDSMYELPREDNIKRVRAKIQNVQHKYLPTDPEVARKRGWKEEEWREYLYA